MLNLVVESTPTGAKFWDSPLKGTMFILSSSDYLGVLHCGGPLPSLMGSISETLKGSRLLNFALSYY